MRRLRRIGWAVFAGMGCVSAIAQTPPVPAPPLVIGRDSREPAQVIGKSFLLRVWLSDVGGAGMQKIYVMRVGVDGNITVPGTPPQHAEGLTIAALEAQVAAPFKASSATAKAWISIVDRSPPPPPPPPPPPAAPAIPPAPTTQPATTPAPVAAATKPATAPAK